MNIRLLTRKEVAYHVGVSSTTISNWVKLGILPKPVTRTGMRPRYSEKHIKAAVKYLKQEH
ncbi:helix-turn-helix transcriptional regulator [Paraferrimonas sedimenticola]|uniref:HTH merR-type domain-containing protein n=1 Tax=Paraferrimonas sedimenticola TaxID=375674 RepID=A0AA37W0E7_9GAMM|nr:hypothetical protein GCM10007895_06290 [Paraferrimonas sedimenticola]